MNFIMTVFGYPFGWLMYGLYHLVSNYGVALVLFTLIVKLLLFPLGLKQQKSTVKMQIIQPKIQEIQAKYKNNQAKMNEELQALYAKENYNPMSGCGTLLIQFPVIFGLLDVVYKPLTHLLRFSKETITALTEVAGTLGIATTGYAPQISIYQSVMQNPAAYSSVGADVIAKIQSLDMGFLGMDLSGTPNLPWQGGWNWLVIIPLLSGLTALLSSVISMKNSPNMGQAGASMKMMMYIMPLISIWFTFMVPIGVGIYWTLSNVFGCVQSLVLNKIYNPKEVAEKLQAEAKERAERERQEKEEEKRRKEEARLERQRRLEEEKKNRGKKKPGQKKSDSDQPGIRKSDSRVGMRTYARGRAYDPNRFGGVTPYHDPNAPEIPEDAVEQARREKGEEAENALAGEELASALPETSPIEEEKETAALESVSEAIDGSEEELSGEEAEEAEQDESGEEPDEDKSKDQAE